MALTPERRAQLKPEDYAVPAKAKMPIRNTGDQAEDIKHTKMAWDMVDRTKGLTDDERKDARRRILQRAHELGINTTDWNTLKAMEFEAMSLDVPTTEGHPNKVPFSGVLTKVNELSDKPPNGSNGKRVMITKDAAEAAIPTILGMGVDLTPDLDGHDPQNKIGIITAAHIDGNDFKIEGFFYGSDFPEEVDYIQANRDDLGFSYEIKRAEVQSLDADHLTVVGLTFSGAAILKKKDAAYTSTSLSANADAEIDMTKEEFEALMKPLTEQVSTLSASVEKILKGGTNLNAASVLEKIKPHSKALRDAADGMEAAGIGMHNTRGHVHLLRKMADNMEAEASEGKIPHMYTGANDYYAGADTSAADIQAAAEKAKADRAAELKPLTDAIADINTKIGDLSAKAFQEAEPTTRKTVSPAVKVLVDKGLLKLDAGAEKKLTAAEVDKALSAANITDTGQRMAVKMDLKASGLMD